VDEGEVVLRLVLPADEQLAAAVEPRGRPFDDPPARPRPAPARAALVPAAANVRDPTRSRAEVTVNRREGGRHVTYAPSGS